MTPMTTPTTVTDVFCVTLLPLRSTATLSDELVDDESSSCLTE